jgi:ketosteroid isomerase-like protein
MESRLDPVALVEGFNRALNARDLQAMMACMTVDCVFENTHPPPDGTRYEGQGAVREFWERFFVSASETRIEAEELVGFADRVIMRWVYTWTGLRGETDHIRGVDLFRVRDGLIAEKLSYVKG